MMIGSVATMIGSVATMVGPRVWGRAEAEIVGYVK